jgi:hypothetical protein
MRRAVLPALLRRAAMLYLLPIAFQAAITPFTPAGCFEPSRATPPVVIRRLRQATPHRQARRIRQMIER